MVSVALVVDVEVVVRVLAIGRVEPDGSCVPIATPIIRTTNVIPAIIRTTDLFIIYSDTGFCYVFKGFPDLVLHFEKASIDLQKPQAPGR
jgi:hypothetical protein